MVNVPHCLNGAELSQEAFRDNLRLCYCIMPLNLPTDCNGCGNKFTIYHTLYLPKGGIVLYRHYNNDMEWGSLGAQT